MARVLIVLPSASYRAADFVAAAKTLRVDAVIATDAAQVMAGDLAHQLVRIDPRRPEWSAGRIVEFAQRFPLDAVVAADDDGVVMAAVAARELGLSHNPPEAVRATRDKGLMRRLFAAAALPQPTFRVIGADDDPVAACAEVGFPCVVKPVSLSTSRGVIRVDDIAAVADTVARVRAITAEAGRDPGEPILAEAFVPGTEIALEGLLVEGHLEVLTIPIGSRVCSRRQQTATWVSCSPAATHPKLSGGGVAAPSPRRADHRHSLNSPAPTAARRNSRARSGREAFGFARGHRARPQRRALRRDRPLPRLSLV